MKSCERDPVQREHFIFFIFSLRVNFLLVGKNPFLSTTTGQKLLPKYNGTFAYGLANIMYKWRIQHSARVIAIAIILES
jgi:hypothetical protein